MAKKHSKKDIAEILRALADSQDEEDGEESPDDEKAETNNQTEARTRTTPVSNMNPKKRMSIIAALKMKKGKK